MWNDLNCLWVLSDTLHRNKMGVPMRWNRREAFMKVDTSLESSMNLEMVSTMSNPRIGMRLFLSNFGRGRGSAVPVVSTFANCKINESHPGGSPFGLRRL